MRMPEIEAAAASFADTCHVHRNEFISCTCFGVVHEPFHEFPIDTIAISRRIARRNVFHGVVLVHRYEHESMDIKCSIPIS